MKPQNIQLIGFHECGATLDYRHKLKWYFTPPFVKDGKLIAQFLNENSNPVFMGFSSEPLCHICGSDTSSNVIYHYKGFYINYSVVHYLSCGHKISLPSEFLKLVIGNMPQNYSLKEEPEFFLTGDPDNPKELVDTFLDYINKVDPRFPRPLRIMYTQLRPFKIIKGIFYPVVSLFLKKYEKEDFW